MRWLCGLITYAVALQPLHTPSRRLRQLHVTGSEDDLRDEIARRNAAKADAPRVPTTQPEPTDPLGFASLLWERTLQYGSKVADSLTDEAPAKPTEDIVVLGSGWGAAALVGALGSNGERVTVVSPRNYFLFTPMLAGAAVGTVEYRSITQPVRSLNKHAAYVEATATAVDTERKVVVCEAVVCEGSQCSIDEFELPYDRVVIAVGATTNTFGVPGVREHCLFLKQIQDADNLRKALGNAFERASLPTLSADERRRALSFCVVGAGPTGVEFCGELRDFLAADAARYYPDLVGEARVTLLEATDQVLGAFDASLRAEALDEFRVRRLATDNQDIAGVDVKLGAQVTEVNGTHVLLGEADPVPYGFCVWATGNGAVSVVSETVSALGEGAQSEAQAQARGRLAVDPWLRVLGAPRGEVYALGDCACGAPPLPATAQVAAQQGEYLAGLLRGAGRYDLGASKPCRAGGRRLNELFCETEGDAVVARPFQFLNLGILAYVGDSKALAQVSLGDSTLKDTGRRAFALWRSVYLAKQVSLRNRVLVAGDWVRDRVFGRDITRF